MEQDVCVSVQNVSKLYRIFENPQDRLKQAIWRGRRFYREFAALRDVSFELRHGETLGVIGVNGSGKSTLLQMIAGTIAPSAGRVEVRGRVAALLELGSGFNPEFTGRSNVYLNGGILGLSREQMDRFMPEIEAFAEIGDFIDQPVKIYSSGMFLRLAFSVQTCVQPDILIVDEALAVGDAAFVHKCINRIKHMAARGVPILFVTHDIEAVRSLCTRVVWLDHGRVRMMGDPREVTSMYMREIFSQEKAEPGGADGGSLEEDTRHWGSGEIRVTQARLLDEAGQEGDVFHWNAPLQVVLEAQATTDVTSAHTSFGFTIRNRNGLDVIAATTFDEGRRLAPWRAGESRTLRFALPNILAPGHYALCACVECRAEPMIKYFDYFENAVVFKVLCDKPVWSIVQPRIECQEMQHGQD